ncbi:MAG: hypothetical protein RBR67_11925 [Desulfobacterium sp.]|nr:hypothetical protein [Desulfobacterium sp.]
MNKENFRCKETDDGGTGKIDPPEIGKGFRDPGFNLSPGTFEK